MKANRKHIYNLWYTAEKYIHKNKVGKLALKQQKTPCVQLSPANVDMWHSEGVYLKHS